MWDMLRLRVTCCSGLSWFSGGTLSLRAKSNLELPTGTISRNTDCSEILKLGPGGYLAFVHLFIDTRRGVDKLQEHIEHIWRLLALYFLRI